jgi:hypothetical protein
MSVGHGKLKCGWRTTKALGLGPALSLLDATMSGGGGSGCDGSDNRTTWTVHSVA